MAAAVNSVPVQHLDDITECPICQEVVNDHRVLPCMHSFCLRCIEGWGRKTKAGADLACPLCRSKFTVPQGGYAALPRNFFIEKLLAVKKLCSNSGKWVLCDICNGEDDEDQTGNKASVYCPECQLHYCDHCSKGHKKVKALMSHKLVELGGQLSAGSVIKNASTSCEKHANKDIEVFCVDCKMAVCMLCYLNSHQSHTCSDLDSVAEDFRKQIMENISCASKRMGECCDIIETISCNESAVDLQIDETERKIRQAAIEMKSRIDDQLQQLVQKLSGRRQARKKEVQTGRQLAEQHKMCLESFTRYCEQLCNNGTACDIARAASSLQNRCSELLKYNIGKQINSTLPNITVGFVPSEFASKNEKELLGSVSSSVIRKGLVKCSSGLPEVSHKVTVCAAILDITAIGDFLLLLVNEGKPQIEVYSSVTLQKLRSLQIPGLQGIGIESSATTNSIYVVCDSSGIVHTRRAAGQNNYYVGYGGYGVRSTTCYVASISIDAISLNTGKQTPELSKRPARRNKSNANTGYEAGLLTPETIDTVSATALFNFTLGKPRSIAVVGRSIVVSFGIGQQYQYGAGHAQLSVQLYDIKGQVERQIVCPKTYSLWSVTPLVNSTYVCSVDENDTSGITLFIIDHTGKLINMYKRQSPGLRGYVALTVDKHNNYILVVDQCCPNKILILDKTLKRSFELPITEQTFSIPPCLHLDELNGTLYVGRNNELLVLDVGDLNSSLSAKSGQLQQLDEVEFAEELNLF